MSKNRTRWLGWGLLVGAAAGVVYTWRRAQEFVQQGPPGMLNWQRIHEVAGRMCATAAPIAASRKAHYTDMVNRSVQMIGDYTGLQLPSASLPIRVLNRQQWLETNLEAFQSVLQPLEELYQRVSAERNLASLLLGEPVRAVLSHQVGLLLGYLAQRVLGQYDIALLGREPLHDGQLYFVEPNIRGVQAQLGLSGDDFPMWVALHESTHAFEFEAHPWLRGHFNALLQGYLAELEPEMEHLSRHFTPAGLGNLVERIRQGESWLLWALTPHQRQIFDQMQAMMCIVEGYSNHVMKQIGQDILPSFALIEARVAARQAQRTPAERLFGRLTGLDLKMEQYRQGEQFVAAVIEQRDLAFLHRVWQQAENLPNLEEIEHSERWIARMEA